VYSAAVLDHFKNPRNSGELPGATASVEVSNPVCGDVTELSVRIEQGRILAVRFRAQGCVAAIACASQLTTLMEGKRLAELGSITPEAILAPLGGLPPASQHAAQLACEALRELLARLK
jgi:nitrogen fixation NifU-like protein